MKSLKFMFFVEVFAKRTIFSRIAPPANLTGKITFVYLSFNTLASSLENCI
jgi:hypothetical protein